MGVISQNTMEISSIMSTSVLIQFFSTALVNLLPGDLSSSSVEVVVWVSFPSGALAAGVLEGGVLEAAEAKFCLTGASLPGVAESGSVREVVCGSRRVVFRGLLTFV